MAVPRCCLKSFAWDGTPTGHTGKLAGLDTYITANAKDDESTRPKVAILFVADALGWTFGNSRLLADHYAREVGAVVYLPDFFGGEVLPFEPILNGEWDHPGLAEQVQGFLTVRNSRKVREPDIFACARALRRSEEYGYSRLGAVGFCYGGWAVARLGARAHPAPLVDCVSMGHPSLLTEDDISGIGVPTQVLAPERDEAYTRELKAKTFAELGSGAWAFDYQYFPGMEHGALTRGSEKVAGEREAMARAKNAAVMWFRSLLL